MWQRAEQLKQPAELASLLLRHSRRARQAGAHHLRLWHRLWQRLLVLRLLGVIAPVLLCSLLALGLLLQLLLPLLLLLLPPLEEAAQLLQVPLGCLLPGA